MIARQVVATAFVLLYGCADQRVETHPVKITRAHACALDDMTVIDHHGPKAQLVHRDNSRAFFCDAKEVFTELLNPIHRKKVAQVWFQTLDDNPWQSHPDGWAEATDLYFVSGSAKRGSMGPTIAPFESRAKAVAFVERYGGKIYQFADIDQAVIKALHQQGMAQF
jgi:copper chaperone NosL